jgi:hypothetical protein
MLQEYLNSTQPEDDPLFFTNLRHDMEEAGIPEKAISDTINGHLNDQQGARNAFELIVLRRDMEEAGIPEKTIAIVMNNNPNNPQKIRELYGLLKETRDIVNGNVTPEREADSLDTKTAIGEKAVKNGFPFFKGTIGLEGGTPRQDFSTLPAELRGQNDIKITTSTSPDDVRAWVRQQHGNKE